jgi:hypothetical protein
MMALGGKDGVLALHWVGLPLLGPHVEQCAVHTSDVVAFKALLVVHTLLQESAPDTLTLALGASTPRHRLSNTARGGNFPEFPGRPSPRSQSHALASTHTSFLEQLAARGSSSLPSFSSLSAGALESEGGLAAPTPPRPVADLLSVYARVLLNRLG